ncbi:InlB B-repeat-containing protein [Methanoregula formicica]|nr:hypothetical protein [Methanoregula formicica]
MDSKEKELNADLDATQEKFSRFSHEGYDQKHRCPIKVPDSYTMIENLTIDASLMNATPHWVFLAAGKTEQKALLSYVRAANVTAKKKIQWSLFLMKSWMKYPVKLIKTDNGTTLVPGKTPYRFSMTSQENRTFQEIERYIAEDMANVQAETATVRWFAEPTHTTFMLTAFSNADNIPDDLKTIAAGAAIQPDSWYSFPVHQMNHGYVPISITPPITGAGIAPDNFRDYANSAKSKFSSHDYEGAFRDMGYASHFMTDLGNPFHTPMVQLIPLEYIDTPFSQVVFPNSQMIVNYEELHNRYEGMVSSNWGMFYDGNTERYDIIEPGFSAKSHAVYSWGMSYPLVYQCYWHFVNTHNTDFSTNSAIVGITKNRISESMKNTRGLVYYVTEGKAPTLTVTASAGTGGSISPAGENTVPYGGSLTFTVTPAAGYEIEDVKVDGSSIGAVSSKTISSITADHTISATFSKNLPPIVALCSAGTAFDATKYPQNWPQSDAMTSQCNWDGNGRVYISGDPGALTGIRADDGFTVQIQPSGATYDAQPHHATVHNIIELTGGMTPGMNTVTVVVRNWMGLSMSYGSLSGIGTDQTPTIIQVNSQTLALSAMEKTSASDLPSFITESPDGLIVNGTLMKTTNESSG